MGYRVIKVPKKDGSVGFKIALESKKIGTARYQMVHKDTWLTHGINPQWTLEQAKAWAQEQNAKKHLAHHAERKAAIQERIREEDLAVTAYLPHEIEEFEREKLIRRTAKKSAEKTLYQWRTVKALMTAIRLDPPDFADKKERIYDWFSAKGYAPASVQKFLKLLNAWGVFYCRKRKLFYETVPAPTHGERKLIAKANRAKTLKRGNRVSEPLTFGQLESQKAALAPEHYNWLYVAIAFGLRPNEVNSLHADHPCRVWVQDKLQVLDVFQSKLDHDGDEDNAWKSIPCVLPEQKRALILIKEGKLAQPSGKILAGRFGSGVTGYCGRNNFLPLMFERGRTLEEASSWLGHKTLKRTYEYWQKLKAKKLITKAS